MIIFFQVRTTIHWNNMLRATNSHPNLLLGGEFKHCVAPGRTTIRLQPS